MDTLEHLTYIPDGSDFHQALSQTTHLAIGAHQDDLEVFAYHGIATCYQRDDLGFGGVTVTNGSGSARQGVYSDFSDEDMIRVRREEQNRAAEIGKYRFQSQFGVPSEQLYDSVAAHRIVDLLVQTLEWVRPETLYLHNPLDKHRTHVALLRLCIQSLRRLDPTLIPKRIYGCEVWRGLDWVRDQEKIALPVNQYPDLARQLIEVFASQVVGGKDYVAATLGRRKANATYLNSHSVDTLSAVTFALDLRPLVEDPTLDLVDFATHHTLQLQKDVASIYAAF